jgi:hypothetical protein
MKKIILLTFFLSTISSFSQNITYQSNPNLKFQDFLKGVRYAFILLDEEDQALIDKLNYTRPHYEFSLEKYLSDMALNMSF